MHNTVSVLTAKEVRMIRNLWATGKLTQVDLANAFGVTNQTISHIVNRVTWKGLV